MIKNGLYHIKPNLAFKAIVLFLVTSHLGLSAQDADKFIRSGNKYYADSNYQAAELKYTKALESDPNSEKGLFNQGNSYYQQQKFEEALQNYEMTAELMLNPKEKAAAYHNLGNAYFKSQQLDKSVEAYKNALRLQPNDMETKYNLALAKKILEQQQQEQQNQDQNQNQDEDQDQDQQKNKDQDNKNQDNQEQDNQDQNQEDQQNQENDGEGDQDQQDKGSEEQKDQQDQKEGQQGKEGEGKEEEEKQMVMPSKLSKEEVERILEALANDELKVQEKLIEKKTPANTRKSDKDW